MREPSTGRRAKALLVGCNRNGASRPAGEGCSGSGCKARVGECEDGPDAERWRSEERPAK